MTNIELGRKNWLGKNDEWIMLFHCPDECGGANLISIKYCYSADLCKKCWEGEVTTKEESK